MLQKDSEDICNVKKKSISHTVKAVVKNFFSTLIIKRNVS